MTVRELEEQSGECVELQTPFAGANGRTYKLALSPNEVWLFHLGRYGWESVRPATVHDVRMAADAERRIV